ncbi:MspA family porin [Gordonia alkaliphila]|uniref:MspA family porin n=1 Tax=Gordonia alkaliphila TaxID=1053547 RepID=UPI001FF1D959|nr:MspA family porin [Gordonia alkaliphila]MCK0439283.1 MspA family porin [Gordonia alkaliphila]
MTALLAGGPAGAKTHQTREGLAIALSAVQQSASAVSPLDSSPLSGQALLSSNVHAAIGNIDGKNVRATLEVGYKIGYPVSVAPNGVKVTAHTPELKLTGGVNAKVAPEVTISGSGGGAKFGDLGAQAGVEANVIPSADLEFEIQAGKIATVTLAEVALTQPVADIVLSGVELNVTNALGPISARPFAKISVTTDTGVYVYYDHGSAVRL